MIQLVRECPPGHGGVERVAHELASAWTSRGEETYTISLKPYKQTVDDQSLPVNYNRSSLPTIKVGRQLFIPLPTWRLWRLLKGSDTIHVHLPCPGLLLISVLARIVRPRRIIRLHWHAFLEPSYGLKGLLVSLYQWMALKWAIHGVQSVITTSPVLAEALIRAGVRPDLVGVLPCCLGEVQEKLCYEVAKRRNGNPVRSTQQPLRLIFIGRLESYKRVDWLIEACRLHGASELMVIGTGTLHSRLVRQAKATGNTDSIHFYGRISEYEKLALLRSADLLVLPADSSNEAFGIVQLEAMACGVPALAFDHNRSGVAWVSGIKKVLGIARLQRKDLFRAINLLHEDRKLLEEASRTAIERYKQEFSRVVWQKKLSAIC
jgi:glycosyltransferase involved in cell wall biosynthesis